MTPQHPHAGASVQADISCPTVGCPRAAAWSSEALEVVSVELGMKCREEWENQ